MPSYQQRIYFRPPTKLREDNVLIVVCHFVRGGETSHASRIVGVPPPTLGYHTPWDTLSLDIPTNHLDILTPASDIWWEITVDLFKLVHLRTYSPSPTPGSNIWWWQLKLKHMQFPSGRYVSYLNTVFILLF